MNRTPIEWTDYSANPLKYRTKDGRAVWACEKLSPGCAHCYAEQLSRRYGGIRRAGEWNAATMAGLEPYLDERELRRMLTYKPASATRCFVGDMTDVFGDWVPDDLLDHLFAVFALRRDVTWQVLTKRPDRMLSYLSGRRSAIAWTMTEVMDGWPRDCDARDAVDSGEGWPLPNVWLGVSCEDQTRADERIPLLLQTPAILRFISAEPLLGPIDLESVPIPSPGAAHYGLRGVAQPVTEKDTEPDDWKYWTRRLARVNWVIVGGESGPDARPCSTEWVRSIVRQTHAAGIACFVKQLGSWPVDQNTGLMVLGSRKGNDPTEWPADLRVRQFPDARSCA